MITVIYDGSFEGLLTAVFEIYEYRLDEVNIVKGAGAQVSLFGKQHNSCTNEEKAARVWKGLKAKLSTAALNQLYRSFLSEISGMENDLYQYIRYVIGSSTSVEHDYSNPFVLFVKQTDQKVRREKHRMEAFIRFQLTGDGLYYAICQPDFNVLPLLEKHFKDRYADQRWLIYDSRRNYGIYYDLNTVETVELTFSDESKSGLTTKAIFEEKEELYQRLWQQYFTSVNIVARKNMKLHLQHMPKRYWKHLTEKQVGF